MINIFPPEIHTYTSSPGGVFRARHVWEENPELEERVKEIEHKYTLRKAFFLAQHHSSDIVVITEENLDEIIFADACVTQLENISLNAVVADCVPILLYDKKRKVIAAVHAGWKGASQRILSQTLQKLTRDFGSSPRDIFLYFGPSICQDCYEVAEEVAELFDKNFLKPTKNSDKFQLDVKQSCIQEAKDFGVSMENIEISLDCTFESPEKYFSYRRTGRKENFAMGIYMK